MTFIEQLKQEHEARKKWFDRIFDKKRLKGVTINDSVDENDIYEYETTFGKEALDGRIYYTILSFDYSDDVAAGEKFIDSMTNEKFVGMEDYFRPYLSQAHKDFMRLLLHKGECIQVKFDNNREFYNLDRLNSV